MTPDSKTMFTVIKIIWYKRNENNYHEQIYLKKLSVRNMGLKYVNVTFTTYYYKTFILYLLDKLHRIVHTTLYTDFHFFLFSLAEFVLLTESSTLFVADLDFQ